MKNFKDYLKEAVGDTVGIMFGRFNPPHGGHRAAWQMASENDLWFIGTNKSTQGKKDPLPYDIKIKAMEALWPEVAGHIVPEVNLFTLASKVYAEHGEVNIIVYTDEEWLIKGLTKYNGEEGKHGYYKFKSITNKPTPRLSSATDVRNAVLADDRDAFERAAGVPADHKIDGKDYFDLVAEYLLPHHTKESVKSDKYKQQYNLKESIMNLSELRKLAGMPIKESMDEGAPVNFKPGYEMSDAQRKLAGIGQLLMDRAAKESDAKMSNAISALGGQLSDGSISTTEDLMSFIKNYKVQGDKDRDQPTPLTDEQKALLSDTTTKAIADYNAGERAAGLKPGETAADDQEGEDEFAVPDDMEVPELEQEGVDLSDIRAEYNVEEAEVCAQCGSPDCTCPPGECDCEPVEEKIEDHVCPECDGSGCEACDDIGGDISEDVVEETANNAMQAALAELRKLAGL